MQDVKYILVMSEITQNEKHRPLVNIFSWIFFELSLNFSILKNKIKVKMFTLIILFIFALVINRSHI